ncbi:MAG TPA: sulfatase-like hydrolase/transferase [Pirellulales bacterium]|jgi:arylsulfatase A-like enzyme
MNIISLVIDRLHVGYLGCYGNSWIGTSSFDRLSADSFVFDQALIHSPDLAQQYRHLTALGVAAGGATTAAAGPSLIGALRASGMSTALISDDSVVAAGPWAAEFDEVIPVDVQRSSQPAEDIEHTNLAKLFAVVGSWLEDAPEPFCLWVHCGSLGFSWDAPLALRQRFAEEDEPVVPLAADVPARRLPEGYDPDELLAVTQAYSGQISLLDLCLGVLLDELEPSSLADRTLLSLLSARGFPLGEHRRVGAVDDALYAELVHVPWMIRLPASFGANDRSPALVQPADLRPTLLDALGLPIGERLSEGASLLPILRGEATAVHDRAFVAGRDGERALRTPAWYLRVGNYAPPVVGNHRELQAELYVKPDDHIEVNDVADRCPEVLELLTEVLDSGSDSSQSVAQRPLADVLVLGME